MLIYSFSSNHCVTVLRASLIIWHLISRKYEILMSASNHIFLPVLIFIDISTYTRITFKVISNFLMINFWSLRHAMVNICIYVKYTWVLIWTRWKMFLIGCQVFTSYRLPLQKGSRPKLLGALPRDGCIVPSTSLCIASPSPLGSTRFSFITTFFPLIHPIYQSIYFFSSHPPSMDCSFLH